MISLKGQYLLSFDLGGNTDFIKETELNEFTIIEEAGNVLPTFALEFNTNDETILPKLNETVPLDLKFGVDLDSAIDIPLAIANLTQIENGKNGVTLAIKGLYNAIDYITDPKLNITSEKSGIEAISNIVSDNFKLDSNVLKSSDKQKWIQPNIPNKKFVSDTLMHSYSSSGFFASAITIDGDFRIRDIEKIPKIVALSKYDYRLTMRPKKSNDILYDNNPVVKSNTGFFNNWLGYGREIFEQKYEDGIVTPFIEVPKPVIALTKNLAKLDDIDKRFGGTSVINDNVHTNYWKAYWKNLTNLVSLSNIVITVTLDDKFYPIHPLDLIMLNIPSKGDMFTSEYLAGLYYVSKVSRTLSNKKFSTTLQLCRESVNQIK